MGQLSPLVNGLTRTNVTTQGTWTPSFGVQGLDVSYYQPNVNWQQQWDMGARFAYVKASEGDYYTNPSFGAQYQGSRSVGMIRGAYHFAIPNWSAGSEQASFFVQNGGGWSADGSTLPPVLDIEFNPYAGKTINGVYMGNTCYDMSAAQLTAWVHDFGNTVRALTGRLPMIYTNTSWWKQCTGDPAGFGDYPLWIAAYPGAPSNDAGSIPASWGAYSVWQYSSTGPFAGDSNVWNGDYSSLQKFASDPAKGSFDSLSLVRDTTSAYLNVTGWSVDLSKPWVSTAVAITVTDPGNQTTGYSFLANGYRPDVDSVYGYGPAHGFGSNIQITSSGTYKVCAAAVGTNGNVDLGCKTLQASGVEPPVGSFDGLGQVRTPTSVSLRLTGWAVDRANAQSATFADAYVTDPDGQTTGYRMSAAAARPDVGTATGYGSNHGFDTLIGLNKAGTYHACVYAIGQYYNTSMGCKDIAVGANPEPKGYYDSLRIVQAPGAANLVATGWAFDPTNTGANIPVHVYVQSPDGTNVGTAFTANQPRPDLNSILGIAGDHGFSASLGIKSTGTYTACAYALSVAPLAPGNTPLGCRTIQVTNTPPTSGYLDSASVLSAAGQTSIKTTGWTYDPAVSGSSNPVHVYITYPDGTRQGYAFTANLPRADVNSAVGISGNHGYSTQVPITQRGKYTVCTYGIGIAQFSSGNSSLGCQLVTY
ncbi:lysozyme [Arthrobacter sp. PAMC25564]|uniref:lysozyme n=1 Tax=Arthrobacter sp. PAMC25564 TaxID=2565366 RepID=UPI001F0E85B7|nr:lysozyme [Arthrobacter sp. PAMC25564]